MLDKNDKWTIPAKVVGARPSGKSYILETDKGIYLRNRKYLRPKIVKEENEEDEECEHEGVSSSSSQQRESRQASQLPRSHAQVAGIPAKTGPQTRSRTKAQHENGL